MCGIIVWHINALCNYVFYETMLIQGTVAKGKALITVATEHGVNAGEALGNTLRAGADIEKAVAAGISSIWEYGLTVTIMALVIIGSWAIALLVIRWLIQNNQDMAAKVLTMAVDGAKAQTAVSESLKANTQEIKDFMDEYSRAEKSRRRQSRTLNKKGAQDAAS